MLEQVGWLGNACFFGRWIVQWIDVERSGSNRATTLFWVLSLVGTTMVGAYAAHRGAPILVAGFVANGAIYLRNLHIACRPLATRRFTMGPLSAVAILAGVILVAASVSDEMSASATSRAWMVCAIVGQGMWSGRFVFQWWLSERAGESHFPVAFWGLSLGGNLLLLAYAIHLSNAVLTVGLLPGPLLHIRNLRLALTRPAATGLLGAESSAPIPASLSAR